MLLRRHERNLRSRTFRSPLEVVFRRDVELPAAWSYGTRQKGISKRELVLACRLSDAAPRSQKHFEARLATYQFEMT